MKIENYFVGTSAFRTSLSLRACAAGVAISRNNPVHQEFQSLRLLARRFPRRLRLLGMTTGGGILCCPVRDLVKCNLSIHRGILAQAKVEGRSCIVYTMSPSKRTDAPKDPVKGMKKRKTTVYRFTERFWRRRRLKGEVVSCILRALQNAWMRQKIR